MVKEYGNEINTLIFNLLTNTTKSINLIKKRINSWNMTYLEYFLISSNKNELLKNYIVESIKLSNRIHILFSLPIYNICQRKFSSITDKINKPWKINIIKIIDILNKNNQFSLIDKELIFYIEILFLKSLLNIDGTTNINLDKIVIMYPKEIVNIENTSIIIKCFDNWLILPKLQRSILDIKPLNIILLWQPFEKIVNSKKLYDKIISLWIIHWFKVTKAESHSSIITDFSTNIYIISTDNYNLIYTKYFSLPTNNIFLV